MKSRMATFALFSIILVGTLIITDKQAELTPAERVLASKQMSLEKRQPNNFVNEVFKDNILLNMAYLDGKAKLGTPVDWKSVRKPFTTEVVLKPHETFAFHSDTMSKYQGKVVKTTNAHFNAEEGFKSDGYLTGDGVCHLASLFNWAAKAAKLDVEAPTSHDFARINEIPKEFGVAIYDSPDAKGVSQQQNLYITNSRSKPIAFKVVYDGENLTVRVVEKES